MIVLRAAVAMVLMIVFYIAVLTAAYFIHERRVEEYGRRRVERPEHDEIAS